MTTVFEAARQADCVQAARRLGLRTRQSGSRAYTCCLFHAERTPSMCLYPGSGGFYCFGCHAHGDAIDLYGKALNLTKLEAARQVCRDFGFQYDEGQRRRGAPPRLPARRADARALAKRLDAMREAQADDLRTRMRSIQEILVQMASSKANWDAVLDEAEWRRALMEQSIAQDQLARLDSMTPAEFLEHVREEGPSRADEKGGTQ